MHGLIFEKAYDYWQDQPGNCPRRRLTLDTRTRARRRRPENAIGAPGLTSRARARTHVYEGACSHKKHHHSTVTHWLAGLAAPCGRVSRLDSRDSTLLGGRPGFRGKHERRVRFEKRHVSRPPRPRHRQFARQSSDTGRARGDTFSRPPLFLKHARASGASETRAPHSGGRVPPPANSSRPAKPAQPSTNQLARHRPPKRVCGSSGPSTNPGELPGSGDSVL
ncbi:hypothetical protein M8J77_007888 [Diaphorina citri]|nr:hypothetical protein M8J77_007888 [Diaphorina citri]